MKKVNAKKQGEITTAVKTAEIVLEKAAYCLNEIKDQHLEGQDWADVDDLNTWGMSLLEKMNVVTVIYIDGKNRAKLKGVL